MMKKFLLLACCATQLYAWEISLTNTTTGPVKVSFTKAHRCSDFIERDEIPAGKVRYYPVSNNCSIDVHFTYPDETHGQVTATTSSHDFKIIWDGSRYNWDK